MTKRPKLSLANGWPQALAGLVVVSAVAYVIAAPSWGESQTAGRLAIGGVVLYAIALLLGWGRLVGITSLPILGASVITFVGNDDPAWARGAVVGVLWYVTAELAWDAIERRDGIRRTVEFNNRRIDEVTIVVFLSLLVTGAAIALSGVAPLRTVLVFGAVIAAIAMALAVVARRLEDSGNLTRVIKRERMPH